MDIDLSKIYPIIAIVSLVSYFVAAKITLTIIKVLYKLYEKFRKQIINPFCLKLKLKRKGKKNND